MSRLIYQRREVKEVFEINFASDHSWKSSPPGKGQPIRLIASATLKLKVTDGLGHRISLPHAVTLLSLQINVKIEWDKKDNLHHFTGTLAMSS